jgi:hypothetical protein
MKKVRSKDIDECSFIWVNGFRLIGNETEPRNGKIVVYFLFEKEMTEEEYQKLMDDFDNCTSIVEPKAFSRRQQDLKNIVYKKIRK